MKEYQSLLKDIKNNQTLPIYFLQGEESFFVDTLTEKLENSILEEEQKAFNQHIFYGLETSVEEVLSTAKQYPFGSEQQLVIVKEAQHLVFTKEADREALERYANTPQMQTILVFAFKGKKLNGNTKLSKVLKKQGYLFTSTPIYDNQVPMWISNLAESFSLSIDSKSTMLLSEHLGNNLSAIHNELKKLQLILGKNGSISPEIIETHVGISKDYNNFELNRAVGNRDAQKSFTILHYFEKNPTQNPLVLSISMLYNLFSKIAIMHVLKDKSDGSIFNSLKIPKNSFVLNEYKTAARNYSLKEATQALDNLLDIDLKSKGVGTTESNQIEILREFIYKTIYKKIK